MAVFTVELGRLIESEFDIGLDEYPIFDEAFREPLNKLITDHFEFREIGQDTPALFKRMLNRKLNEIMPYYNELYKSQLIEFNPLYSQLMDSTSTTTVNHDSTTAETSAADSDNTATGRTLISTTPQTQLSGTEDYASGLTDNTSAGKNITTATNTGEAADNAVTDYAYHVAGFAGQNPSDAIMRFRRSLINVNIMVLDELEVLFMGLWYTTEAGGM